jgi:hypothetical protein
MTFDVHGTYKVIPVARAVLSVPYFWSPERA